MSRCKRILLISGAALLWSNSGQAADLPYHKAAPVEYVRICDAFGTGFFYIPGTDTCIRLGGSVRAEMTFRGGAPTNIPASWSYNLAGQVYRRDLTALRATGYLNEESKTQTAYGTLRTYLQIRIRDETTTPGPLGGGKITVSGLPAKASAGLFQGQPPGAYTLLEKAFIQFAGLTAGRAPSFFDFDGQSYELLTNSVANSNQPITMFAYTATFGSGFSATLSAEDRADRSVGDSGFDTAQGNPTKTKAGYLSYAGETIPDIVGNLRVDQPWGAAQLAAAYHRVDSIPVTLASGAVLTPGSKDGFAGIAGVKINVPFIAPGDNVTLQASYEQGAMDYVNALNNWNGTTNVFAHKLSISVPVNDAFILPNGSIGLNKSGGFFGAYQHYWTPTIRSALYSSWLKISNPYAAQLLAAGADNAKVWDVGLNTIWSPVKGVDIGGEILYTHLHLSGAFDLTTTTPYATPKTSSDWRGRLSFRRTF